MGRRRQRFCPESVDRQLERRVLMSRADASPVVAALGGRGAEGVNLFHQNGINGFVLHRAFVNQLNDRFNASKSMTTLVSQAFQVFATNFQQLPVNPPAGSSGPTLSGLIATLKQQVAVAEVRRVSTNVAPSPSEQSSINNSPLAPRSLVPYSDEVIDQMATTLATLPTVAGSDGTLSQGDPTPAVDTAVNAIFNAIAEFTTHPNLFRSPSDFYLNPQASFTSTNAGASPAQSAPGYFIRGPRGAILPGATLHPYAPN